MNMWKVSWPERIDEEDQENGTVVARRLDTESKHLRLVARGRLTDFNVEALLFDTGLLTRMRDHANQAQDMRTVGNTVGDSDLPVFREVGVGIGAITRPKDHGFLLHVLGVHEVGIAATVGITLAEERLDGKSPGDSLVLADRFAFTAHAVFILDYFWAVCVKFNYRELALALAVGGTGHSNAEGQNGGDAQDGRGNHVDVDVECL